jgi:pimeloyl-ACP methyl ester carboxylesterase
MDGWTDANIAFMRSGGYSISSRIQEVQQPTLVLWGRQDEILEPKYAAQFEAALPNGQLQWIEDCGHCAHLEKPTEVCCKGCVRHTLVGRRGGHPCEFGRPRQWTVVLVVMQSIGLQSVLLEQTRS